MVSGIVNTSKCLSRYSRSSRGLLIFRVHYKKEIILSGSEPLLPLYRHTKPPCTLAVGPSCALRVFRGKVGEADYHVNGDEGGLGWREGARIPKV